MLSLREVGDVSENNHRPISKLSVLAKFLESQLNLQFKQFLLDDNIGSDFQPGVRTGFSTVPAAVVVTNDLIGNFDRKQNCAALFVDLFKASDSVDDFLLNFQNNVGFSPKAVKWFRNYLVA